MNSHAVYFYAEDFFLIDKVAHFVRRGLDQNETVIVIATAEHRAELKSKLMAENVIGLLASSGRNYVPFDVSTILDLVMHNGWPHESLFLKVMGQMIESSASGAPVRIYGEMVAVLCAEGKQRAAIRLEELWNKLAMQCEFSLLCGYPLLAFQGHDNALAFQHICACHSQVMSNRG